jgi:hypothetical protein
MNTKSPKEHKRSWRDAALIEIHPACAIIPEMTVDELRALSADIKANGLNEPIAIIEKAKPRADGTWHTKDPRAQTVLDGCSRLDGMEEAGSKARTRKKNCADPAQGSKESPAPAPAETKPAAPTAAADTGLTAEVLQLIVGTALANGAEFDAFKELSPDKQRRLADLARAGHFVSAIEARLVADAEAAGYGKTDDGLSSCSCGSVSVSIVCLLTYLVDNDWVKAHPDHNIPADLAEYFATTTRPRFNRLDLIRLIRGLTDLADAWRRRESPTPSPPLPDQEPDPPIWMERQPLANQVMLLMDILVNSVAEVEFAVKQVSLPANASAENVAKLDSALAMAGVAFNRVNQVRNWVAGMKQALAACETDATADAGSDPAAAAGEGGTATKH